MRMKILGARGVGLGLVLLVLLALIAAAAGPERLCASTPANTSAHLHAHLPSPLLAFHRTEARVFDAAAVVADDPAIQPRRPASAPTAASAAAGTPDAAPAAVPTPAPATEAGAPPIRIALLLPLRSATLADAAEAVRAGFLAGFEREGAGAKVDIVATGDDPRDVLDAYARAAAASDIVVGPLARAAASALADSDGVSKPTVVLSAPAPNGARTTLPRLMVVAGLSVEDEARQVADWAGREHPQGRVLILTGSAAWAQRAAAAFDARWRQRGQASARIDLPSATAASAPAAVDALAQRLDSDPPDVLFAALDATELSVLRQQVDALAGTRIPCYGGGAANPGRAGASDVAGLDGVRILDLPWIVAPDHPAVLPYPRPPDSDRPLDMARLYALGIDAFRVARGIALHPDAPFAIDGVTGRLTVSVDADTHQLRLERREAAATVRSGGFDLVDGGP
jgi:outer membrane PBP1 activator LpoA protein